MNQKNTNTFLQFVNTNKSILIIVLIIILLASILIYYIIKKTSNPDYVKTTLVSSKTNASTLTSFRYLLKDSPYNESKSMTFAFWIYINDIELDYTDTKYIFHSTMMNNSEFDLILGKKNKPDYSLTLYTTNINNENEILSLGSLEPNKWIHVVLVFEDRYVQLFIDGVIQTVKVMSNFLKIDTENDVSIGYNDGFNGLFSKFYHYNYKISSSDILGLYKNGYH